MIIKDDNKDINNKDEKKIRNISKLKKNKYQKKITQFF